MDNFIRISFAVSNEFRHHLFYNLYNMVRLKDQLENVGKEKHVLEVAMDRLEEELRRYRAQPFSLNEFRVIFRVIFF